MVKWISYRTSNSALQFRILLGAYKTKRVINLKNLGMSKDMYNFIVENCDDKLVFDLENGLIITPRFTNGTICSSTGYLRVRVNDKVLQVHQILAVKYYGEACIGMQINHIDGNKLNNKKSNLEAITMKENLKHQRENGLLGKPVPINKKKVDKYTKDGIYICTYDSINEACKDVGLKSTKSIRDVLNGVYSTAKGFVWKLHS